MSDGSSLAAQYDVPVHFEAEGAWVDYDNTLIEETVGERVFLKNKTADYTILLPRDDNGVEPIRYQKDGFTVQWRYPGAQATAAKVREPLPEDGDLTTLEKLTSSATYPELFPGVDAEYRIGSDGVKENLLLQSAEAPNEFFAAYQAEGLSAVSVDEKTVALVDAAGGTRFILYAPYMTDAAGEACCGERSGDGSMIDVGQAKLIKEPSPD